jgi:hypothetical protein
LYCTGLLLPGERKSVEAMAARLAPDNVRQTHQSLHHVVADAPWNDEELLEVVRHYALAAMQKRGPVEAWMVDDTGLVKKGKHKPPSSDRLAGPQRPRGCRQRKRKKRRKAEGQKGHPGHWRPLVPLERVNRVVPVFPEQCGPCHQALPKDTATRVTEGEPRRHQVRELPEIQADITEYQMPNVVGPGCGQTTQAPVPPEVRGHFGPRLTAALAYMTVICHIPRRALQCLGAGLRYSPQSGHDTKRLGRSQCGGG